MFTLNSDSCLNVEAEIETHNTSCFPVFSCPALIDPLVFLFLTDWSGTWRGLLCVYVYCAFRDACIAYGYLKSFCLPLSSKSSHSTLTSTQHCHLENCCSLDIFFFFRPCSEISSFWNALTILHQSHFNLHPNPQFKIQHVFMTKCIDLLSLLVICADWQVYLIKYTSDFQSLIIYLLFGRVKLWDHRANEQLNMQKHLMGTQINK